MAAKDYPNTMDEFTGTWLPENGFTPTEGICAVIAQDPLIWPTLVEPIRGFATRDVLMAACRSLLDASGPSGTVADKATSKQLAGTEAT